MRIACRLVLGLLALFCGGAAGARILAFLPSPPSHMITFTALTTALADRGHQVTLVSSHQPFRHPNQTWVDVSELEAKFKNNSIRALHQSSFDSVFTKLMEVRNVSRFGDNIKDVMDCPHVQEILDMPAGSYDLVFIEPFFGQEFLVGLGHKFKAPVVGLNSLGECTDLSYYSGSTFSPAFRPQPHLDISDRMNFRERLWNTIFVAFRFLQRVLEAYPMQQRLLDQYFPGGPPLVEQLSNISLHVINSDHTMSYPAATTPMQVFVGGMHVQHNPKPLPKDLKDFLDGAEHGAICFTMGSLLKASEMTAEQKEVLFETFRARKERVVMRWNDEPPKNLPSNVKLMSWLPQDDVLAHPRVRVFITHGGLLGTQETVFHGKPVIGIPRYGDQRFNMQLAVRKGYGVLLDLRNLTRTSLGWALTEVLDNPRYTEAVRRFSELVRSQQVRPIDKAVFWVEHVLKHGAEHLRPSSTYLSWYQLLLLDVIAVVMTLLLAGTLVVLLLVRWLVSRCHKALPTAASIKKKSD